MIFIFILISLNLQKTNELNEGQVIY